MAQSIEITIDEVGNAKVEAIGCAGSGNIKGRSMVRAGANQGQTERHIDAFFNTQVLHRDQSLVVVHGYTSVKFSLYCFYKHSIRRERPLNG